MTDSLYARLGGSEGIAAIADDLVEIHVKNPRISTRYLNSDLPRVKRGAANFFITGTGGPDVYEGKDMATTHRGMNIDSAEFLAVLDDALEALEKNGIGQREKEEVLYVLYSMKSDIVHL